MSRLASCFPKKLTSANEAPSYPLDCKAPRTCESEVRSVITNENV